MIRTLAILSALALLAATPAQAQTISWSPGVDCQANALGEDCIITPSLMQPAFAAYQVAPPLNRVWSGDDPTSPTLTVELQFPDLATAQSVLAGLWTAS